MNDKCAFCGLQEELQESHIIPGFVFRWFRESSATGHVRFSQTPNRRVQDGYKRPLLCGTCEGLFNSFETPFAQEIFHPLHSHTPQPFKYRSWMAKFCASVAWRVLYSYQLDDHLDHLPDAIRTHVDVALDVWAKFIRGECSNPAQFELHALPLDVIERTTDSSTPTNMSRYLSRNIDMNVCFAGAECIVYVKMCRFLMIAFICNPRPHAWQNSRLRMNRGLFGGKVTYVMPPGFMDHLKDRARLVADFRNQLSPRQTELIEKTARANPGRVANSEFFRAMSHDVMLFGEDVFIQKSDDSSE